jgi:hypothetical protein
MKKVNDYGHWLRSEAKYTAIRVANDEAIMFTQEQAALRGAKKRAELLKRRKMKN